MAPVNVDKWCVFSLDHQGRCEPTDYLNSEHSILSIKDATWILSSITRDHSVNMKTSSRSVKNDQSLFNKSRPQQPQSVGGGGSSDGSGVAAGLCDDVRGEGCLTYCEYALPPRQP